MSVVPPQGIFRLLDPDGRGHFEQNPSSSGNKRLTDVFSYCFLEGCPYIATYVHVSDITDKPRKAHGTTRGAQSVPPEYCNDHGSWIMDSLRLTSCTSRRVASCTSFACWRQSGEPCVTNRLASGLRGTGLDRTSSGLKHLHMILCPRAACLRCGVAAGSSDGKARQKLRT